MTVSKASQEKGKIMKKTKRIVALLTAVVMAFSLTACSGQSGSSSTGTTAAATTAAGGSSESAAASTAAEGVLGDGSNKYLTVAACPASSALYPFWVSIGDILDKAFTNVYPTVSESQGAVAITKRVRTGEAELGNSVSATDYESYNGTGTFDGDADPNLRMLFYYEVTWEMLCADASAGINNIEDLQGKKFCPGGTGTSAESICKDMCALFGVEPNWFTASQSDASDAYSNREIVGTVKLGPMVDSYVMQLNASSAIKLISLTDEQITKVTEKFPYLISGTIPAGTYDGQTEDVNVVGTPQGCQTQKGTFTQEEQYQICKAVFEDYADLWKTSYPSGAQNDLYELTLQSSIPLSAGTVQFLTEKGYEVPEAIIPEEYVPVN